jgi:predicted nucleic acid-binding protein
VLGRQLAPRIDEADIVAPELLDAEVLAVLRRATIAGRLPERRARLALEDLAAWSVLRIRHARLVLEAWKFRQNVSGYDALYLAAARLHGAAVLTCDGPLARAPGLGVLVENVRA